MRIIYLFISFIFCFSVSVAANAQNDSAAKVNNGKEILPDTLAPGKDSAVVAPAKKDSVSKAKHNPRKATLRSAIIPGWGQAYNREYWKIPIVYGALAVPASLFAYNNRWYQKTKRAYTILVNEDTANFNKIDPKLVNLSASDLQYYRNDFRRNRDYSVIFFLLVWGLNVADATVFAHLKNFNVGDDLSLHIQPDFNITTKTPALQVALNFRDKQPKILPSAF